MLHEWYLKLDGLLFYYFVSNTQEITKNTLNITPTPQKTSRRDHSEISGIYIATCFQPFKTVKQLLNTLSITHHTWANFVILFSKCKFSIRKIWCWNSGSSTTKNYPDKCMITLHSVCLVYWHVPEPQKLLVAELQINVYSTHGWTTIDTT